MQRQATDRPLNQCIGLNPDGTPLVSSLSLSSPYRISILPDADPLLFRTLRLDNNKLSGLPEGLLTLTSLTHLSLRHNNFSNLPYRFGDLHCLKKLDLGENMLKTLPPTMVRPLSTRCKRITACHRGLSLRKHEPHFRVCAC